MEESRTLNTEIEFILQEYRKCTKLVKANMDWEDYLSLIEIAAETNANNVVDLAWWLEYLAGEAALLSRIKNHFFEKGGVK